MSYTVWEQLLLPARAKEDRIDVLHCTGNTAAILLDRRIRVVLSAGVHFEPGAVLKPIS